MRLQDARCYGQQGDAADSADDNAGNGGMGQTSLPGSGPLISRGPRQPCLFQRYLRGRTQSGS